MELAAAALGDHGDLPAAGAACVGRIEAALHFELGDGIDAREGHQREVAAAIHVIGAVHRPVVGGVAVAVDGVRQVRGGAGWRRVADVQFVGGARNHARHEGNQLLVVARGDGQLAHLLAVDRIGAGGGAQFDVERRCLHRDRIAHGAYLEGDVDLQIVAHIQGDAGAGLGLETSDLHLDRVLANRNQWHRVGAGCVRRHYPDHLVAVGIGDRNLGVGHSGATGVQYCPADGAGNVLRDEPRRQTGDEHKYG